MDLQTGSIHMGSALSTLLAISSMLLTEIDCTSQREAYVEYFEATDILKMRQMVFCNKCNKMHKSQQLQ